MEYPTLLYSGQLKNRTGEKNYSCIVETYPEQNFSDDVLSYPVDSQTPSAVP